MADLEVDANKLYEDGDQFNNMAAVAYSIYSALADGMSRLNFPEDDKISRVFAEQWNSLVDGTKGLLLGFRDGMHDVAGNVGNTAALYKKSNEVNLESVASPKTVRR